MSLRSNQSIVIEMDSSLTKGEQRVLLGIARQAIVGAIVHKQNWIPGQVCGQLAELRGAFVTLEMRGHLRGCVGQPNARNNLARTVAHCAVSASREDTRFSPVRANEVDEISIEISVLSKMEPVELDQIEIGRHGLMVVRGGFRGLLLPQVALKRCWTRKRFLEETCRKACLPSIAWQLAGTHLYGFTADVFTEVEFTVDGSSPKGDFPSHTRFL